MTTHQLAKLLLDGPDEIVDLVPCIIHGRDAWEAIDLDGQPLYILKDQTPAFMHGDFTLPEVKVTTLL